ncbi:MAG: hypothetical protein WD512_04135, partial [Candidatus Paceibacterota bacterium]
KNFNLFFSIGCFRIIERFPDMEEMEKRMYLLDGIQYYNKFLKKNLRMRLTNLDEINSKFLINSSAEMTHEGSLMLNILAEGYKLELAKFMTERIGNKQLPILKIDPITDRIKDYFPFIISTITTLATILSLVFGYFLTKSPS